MATVGHQRATNPFVADKVLARACLACVARAFRTRGPRVAPKGPPGTVVGTSGDGVVVACGHGALELLVVQPEGRRAMAALDYERGRRGGDGAPRVLDDGE